MPEQKCKNLHEKVDNVFLTMFILWILFFFFVINFMVCCVYCTNKNESFKQCVPKRTISCVDNRTIVDMKMKRREIIDEDKLRQIEKIESQILSIF